MKITLPNCMVAVASVAYITFVGECASYLHVIVNTRNFNVGVANPKVGLFYR